MADDSSMRLNSINPLFMKYIPTEGKFSGQSGYGYRLYFDDFLCFLLTSMFFIKVV